MKIIDTIEKDLHLNQPLLEALIDGYGPETIEEALEYMDDHYAGEYESLADWAEQYLTDSGVLESIPENIRPYFDCDAYGRDAEIGGDIFTVELGYRQVHVFYSH